MNLQSGSRDYLKWRKISRFDAGSCDPSISTLSSRPFSMPGFRQQRLQRTPRAPRSRAAMPFACFNDQRMELVVVIGKFRIGIRRLKVAFDKSAYLFVFGIRSRNTVSLKNAFRICIDNEDRKLARIEQDRVRGFRTYAVKFEQLASQIFKWPREHA